jgi:hypothetical protein
MIVMAANAAGIAGSQVFQTQDAPLYLKAFTVCLALNGLAVLEIIWLAAWYYMSNKKLDSEVIIVPEEEKAGAGTSSVGSRSEDELVREWRWAW